MSDKINYVDFSAKIKEKYPEYKDIDDNVLAKKVIEKYPDYKDIVDFGLSSQKKSPNESQEDGGGDLQTQSKQEQTPVVETTSTLQTIKDNAMPIVFAGLSISFVILIVFLFLKFKTRMGLFFSNLFKSTTFKIICAVILGFLLFTNPSIKDFEEFYPSEHKSTRERACKEFDLVSRQTNLLLFSIYKVQNRYKDCNAFPNVYYLGIAKNFIFLNEEK